MNKKNLSILLIVALLLSSLSIPVFGAEEDETGIYEETRYGTVLSSDSNSPAEEKPYLSVSADEAHRMGLIFETDNGEITITDYNGSATSITIPGEIDGVKVTKIGDEAFGRLKWENNEWIIGNPELTEVILPNTITTIGYNAFYKCGLKDFDMPDSVTSIALGGIGLGESLETLKISNNISDNLNSLMYECDNLKKLYLPVTKEIKDGYYHTENSEWCSDFPYLFTNIPDIYYAGNQTDWRNTKFRGNDLDEGIVPNNGFDKYSVFRSYMHFNSSVEDYRNNKNAGKGDDWNAASTPVTVSLSDSASVTYNSNIAYYWKKAIPENFGTITISYNGKEYTASKIKVNKKKNKLQITDITPADKQTKKAIKKLTKGDKGLDFTVGRYFVTHTSDIKYVMKGTTMKSLSVKINGSYYKVKKDHFGYCGSNDYFWALFGYGDDEVLGMHEIIIK